METQKIDVELLKTLPLPAWDEEASKADRGKLLVVAGSKRIPGAAILVARAALRSGCGTVRVASPESVSLTIGVAVPELLVVPLPETKSGTLSQSAVENVANECRACQALVVGPGLGGGEETDGAVREIVEAAPLPMVVDAEALSALGDGFSFAGIKAARVLTPHEKEFESLANLSLEDADDEKRAKIAADYARAQKVTLVLKGRFTFIVSGWRVYYSISAPPAAFWHAIIHRREGDFSNARYWWARTGDHAAFEPIYDLVLHRVPDFALLDELRAAGRWLPLEMNAACQNFTRDGRFESELRATQRLEMRGLLEWCAARVRAGH